MKAGMFFWFDSRMCWPTEASCLRSVSSRVVSQLVPLRVLPLSEVDLLEGDLDLAEEEVLLEAVAVPDGHVQRLVAQHLQRHAPVLELR